MWYVIGAVLVGAAILLLLNGTAPDLFAQVAGTYEEKTEEATEQAETIEPLNGTNGVNLLGNNSDDWQSLYVRMTASGYVKNMSLEELGLEAGDEITWSGLYDFGEHTASPRFMFTPVPWETDDETEQNIVGDEYTDTGKFEFTGTVPEDASYLTLRLNNDSDISKFFAQLKHQKLETGPRATSYQ